MLTTGLRILELYLSITTVLKVANQNADTVATKLNNAVSTLQAAVMSTGFPATVAPATVVFNPNSAPSTVDSNTKGKNADQNMFSFE
jgi:hypothetical protein